MGYLFYSNNRAKLVADLTEKAKAKRVVGSTLFAVFHNAEKGIDFIGVFLLRQSQGQWGYKAMDEDQHPYYYGCPESILKLSTCMEPSAVAWREKNRALRTAEKDAKDFAAGLKEGDSFEWNGERIEYVRPYHKASYVIGRSVRGVFKYKIKDIRRPQ